MSICFASVEDFVALISSSPGEGRASGCSCCTVEENEAQRKAVTRSPGRHAPARLAPWVPRPCGAGDTDDAVLGSSGPRWLSYRSSPVPGGAPRASQVKHSSSSQQVDAAVNPIHRWGNRGTERRRGLPEVTELRGSGTALCYCPTLSYEATCVTGTFWKARQGEQ